MPSAILPEATTLGWAGAGASVGAAAGVGALGAAAVAAGAVVADWSRWWRQAQRSGAGADVATGAEVASGSSVAAPPQPRAVKKTRAKAANSKKAGFLNRLRIMLDLPSITNPVGTVYVTLFVILL